MTGKTSLLPLPAAIDAAYLLLVGQLCYSLSKLAFGAAFVTENSISVEFFSESSMLWVIAILIVVMLFVNIMSCWRSTRSTFEELGHYPNELLTSDIFIIVAFFLLNSVAGAPVSFMSSVSLNNPDITTFVESLKQLWEPVVPLVFFSSALLVMAYRSWNISYVKVLKSEVTDVPEAAFEDKENALKPFNRLYVAFSIIFSLFGIVLFLTDDVTIVAFMTIIWISFWLYVNFSWVIYSPPDKRP